MPRFCHLFAVPLARSLSLMVTLLIPGKAQAMAVPDGAVTNSAASDYLIDVWDSGRGLPENSVVSLAQTPDGYLWLGTLQAGVARFDGVRFTSFDPANSPGLPRFDIQRLTVDSQGVLWVAMVGGFLTRFEAGRFTVESGLSLSPRDAVNALVFSRSNEVVFATIREGLIHGWRQPGTNSVWEKISLPDAEQPIIHYRAANDGRIWYRRKDQRLGCWKDGQVEPLKTYEGFRGERVSALATDVQGRFWVGTEKGIFSWNGAGFEEMTPTNREPEVAVQDFVFAGDGGLWVRTKDRLRKCAGRKWVAEANGWSEVPIPTAADAADLHGDRDGGVWFRHRHQGVWRVQPDGGMQHLSDTNGLPNGLVDCWLQDQEGNVWLGFEGGGLVRLRPRHFQILRRPDSPVGAVVRSVCEDAAGAIWLGGSDGKIFHWREGTFGEVSIPGTRVPVRDVTLWPSPQDGMWAGTVQNGAWIWNEGRMRQPFPSAAIGTVVRALMEDRQGRMWLGSEFGLYCWSDGKLQKFTQAEGFSDNEYVLALAQDVSGAIWIGTAEGYLWRFQSGRFTVFKLPSSLPRFRFWSLLADPDGSVWVGTLGGGLLRWRDGQLRRCTSADGLPSDTISQLLEDDLGNLWAGSRAGIFSVNRAALNALLDGKPDRIFCRSFGISDGLPTLECSAAYQPSCWRGKDGRLWFATVKGVVWVQPGDLLPNRLPPDVVIEGVRVDGVAQIIRPPTPALILSAGRHYVEFRFTGLSLTAPESVRFQWRLAGLEQNWVDGGGQRTVSYNFLPPGHYRFEVRACNSDGVWNETGAAINITVRPHVWETEWFKFGSGVVGLLLFLGAGLFIQRRCYWARMQAIERQNALERERTRIARDIHDQVGANLTKIGIQTGQLGRQPGMPAEAQTLVQEVAETTREMLQSMDEIVWAINPRNDTLESAINYLIHYTRDYLRPAGISYQLDLPVDLPVLPLSTQVRHNLFMAFKEALNNAVKHGHPRNIRLVLELQPHELKLAVEDDGCGFTPATSRDGADGLDNMRQRLKSLGGQCLIESAPGRGTRVTFQLPRQIPVGPDTHLHVY